MVDPLAIYEALFATRLGAFGAGIVFTMGLVISALSFCFYFVYRKKVLLLFALLQPLLYPVVAFINANPRDLYDLGGDPFGLPLLYLVTALGRYLFYLIIKESVGELRGSRIFRAFSIITMFSIVIKVLTAVVLTEDIIRVSSFFSALFFIMAALVGLCWKALDLKENLLKISFVAVSLISVFSFARSGLLPTSSLDSSIFLVLVPALEVISFIWFFALVEISRQSYEEAKIREIERRARAFIELRELMNTPLQILEISMEMLKDEQLADTTQSMQNALKELTNISRLLNRFDTQVNWEENSNFFEERAIKRA